MKMNQLVVLLFVCIGVHVFTPWMIIMRTLGSLPFVVGIIKKNIFGGMITHSLGDSVHQKYSQRLDHQGQYGCIHRCKIERRSCNKV
jgi:hypothetical protein